MFLRISLPSPAPQNRVFSLPPLFLSPLSFSLSSLLLVSSDIFAICAVNFSIPNQSQISPRTFVLFASLLSSPSLPPFDSSCRERNKQRGKRERNPRNNESMDPMRGFLFQAFLFTLVLGLAGSSTFISDSVFESERSTGRNLLQQRKACPVNFEFMNYTIITSQCKGPQYPAKLCCAALVQFSCPYADAINDGTNDCASTMFSYINLYGKYPPGLFASECKGDKLGLICPAEPPGGSESDTASAHITRTIFPHVALISVLVLGFLFS